MDNTLYTVSFPVSPQELEIYQLGKWVVPLDHKNAHDRVLMAWASLYEAIFVQYPTEENAVKWLKHIWPLVERFQPGDIPTNEFGEVETEGFIPTGRILVTQGRALPEFYEYWTSVGYSAFILQAQISPEDSGWDCNEFTGDVLREAGLNGMGFPSMPDNAIAAPDDLEVGEPDMYDWEYTIETVGLSRK